MKIIVTGHLGYIGKVLVPKLLSKGYNVTGIDLGLYSLFDFPHDTPHIKIIKKDIRDIQVSDLKGHDSIIHLAALSNDPLDTWKNYNIIEKINRFASVELAKKAKKAGIQRFIFSSSCSVYGKAADPRPRTELDQPLPITEYAKSKYNTENDIKLIADKQFCPIYMRNATVYGYSPSIRFDMLVNNFTAAAYFNKLIQILGDGNLWRPQINIHEISEIFILMLEAPREKIFNETFNVGFNNENIQIKGIAEKVKKVIYETEISIAKKFDPDARSYRVDFSKLMNTLKPKHSWNVEKGVQEIYENLKKVPLTKEQFNNKAGQRMEQLKNIEERFPNFLK